MMVVSLVKDRVNFNSRLFYVIFLSYLPIHLFIYSLALERLLTSIYGKLFTINSPFLSFSFTPFIGNSLLSLAYNLIFNPSITIGFPPNYFLDLSFYSISMGIIIALFIASIMDRVVYLYKKTKLVKEVLIIPILGVIGGGSCCVSIPLILATSIPVANIILLSPVGDLALFIAYITLPPLTALILGLHFRTLIFPKKRMKLLPKNLSRLDR